MNLVGRVGGDEYLVVLSDTLLDGEQQCADLVPESVVYQHSLGSSEVTLSAGVAVFCAETDASRELIRTAEEDICRLKAGKSLK